ncbi:MAG: hypothetical protein O7H41_05420 [Planctomycetota bacterium]|nr:hypothetical protein [Planctomycetota bacterium]
MNGLPVGSRSVASLGAFLTLIFAISILGTVPVAAQDRKKRTSIEELHEVLEGLERGLHALEILGKREEMEILHRIANGVRRELAQEREGRRRHGQRTERERVERERGGREREVARRHIQIMKEAMPALLEKGRKDTAKLLEHAIHARELALEGRRDDEAHRIRETAPNRGQQVEILRYAAGLWREFGHPDKAGNIEELAKWMWESRERPAGERRERDRARGERDGPRRRGEDRERVVHQIEVMQVARAALLESSKEDAAHVMKRAIQVRKVNLEGHRGEEAEIVRKRAPHLEQEVEILGFASRLLRERGKKEKAKMVGQLAEGMWAHDRKRRDREGGERDRGRKSRGHRLERLQKSLHELQRAIDELKEEFQSLRHSSY